MQVQRIIRVDDRLVTLSDLKTLYRQGKLENPDIPYQHRITEEDTDDNPVLFTYHSEIGKYVQYEDDPNNPLKKVENLLMWGNEEGCNPKKWKANGKKLRK